MIRKRDLQFFLIGGLFASGVTLIVVGLMYRSDVTLAVQSIIASPVFNIPKEINRDYVIDVIDRTNIERKRAGLEVLKESSALSYAAYLRAKDILDNQDFSHIATNSGNIKAQEVVQIIGYRYSEVGENLAMGINDPNEVVAKLLASPEHRNNILSKSFDETGVAVLNGRFLGQDNTDIVVQLFGHR